MMRPADLRLARCAAAACLCVTFFLAGCVGYQLGSQLPPGIRSVYVPVFVNRTAEPNLEAQATAATIQELQKDGSLRVVGPEEADAILEVTLTGYDLAPLRYRRDQATTAREYRLTLKADVLLRKRATQEVIAKVSAEGYTTLDAVSDLPTARRIALPQAARSLALHIIKSVTEYWGE